ncbi:CorA family divalent cation transporter [Gelidibacter salicanalis]|uniref:Magnesium transport protein CorA n=1 Tax=Gelidibacter salicanalis TaxID=291193 RepID=A0A934KSS5_9FLAO|nr:CorA family divalent cation transporter [Gelidibacter salicanalis]MBJ7880721.1 magnesium and cobalt transport protein CorA [Gelidibacter salicanalis]
MIKFTSRENGQLKITSGLDAVASNCIWINLIDPTEEDKNFEETTLKIELFTRQEREEIESSSKYIESDNEIGINLNFLSTENENFINEPISSILKDNFLINQRQKDYKTFSHAYYHKIKPYRPKNGIDVFLTLLEISIDFDADFIKSTTDKITALQETTISIRENIIEKQRILSATFKTYFFSTDKYDTIRIIIKDYGSLLEHTNFNFDRLEFLQNTFLGLVDIEQNQIIKIFTVVTVIFMAPTLIASMYGMNFKYMPELDKTWGYPFAIGFMVLSSLITLLFFRRKNWL